MKIESTIFSDLFVLNLSAIDDERGRFVKTIHDETFKQHGLEYQFTESFFSVNNANVIRGMHFQSPPFDHVKLVYVVVGRILDVVVDLRSNSETYGKYFKIELSAENHSALYIGKGFAHGFLAAEENSIVEYHTTTSQNRQSEGGLLFNSFGFEWPVVNPIVSKRDSEFLPLQSFKTPF